jgi:flagellar biosynthesis protein FlhF
MVADLCRRAPAAGHSELPAHLFRVYTDLLDAEVDESLARELVERVRGDRQCGALASVEQVKSRLAEMLEGEIRVQGPIGATVGERRLVALVGPTGVGKTTTIAKLAANFRLREKRKVGLITVDTYRIAAVEQLRTYADIIDLPMHVASTPREMRAAVLAMQDMDLVLMDTAGRGPSDEVKIRELRAFLQEAAADEVHLVLSAASSPNSLLKAAESFAPAGATALILTKLDEATGLGGALPLVRSARLPLSYLTMGQNVPDDIEPARAERLVKMILGLEPTTRG